MNGGPYDRCPFCGAPAPVIWVHGHGQCAFCGTSREPCCDGAPEEPGHAGLPTLMTARLILRPSSASAEPCPPGYGRWTIVEAQPDDLAGERGIGAVAMLPCAQDSREIELSFQIDLVARGQGFAREAAKAVIDDAERRLGVTELVAFTHPDHRAPARVLARLGFRADGRRVLSPGMQVVVWRRSAG